MNKTLVMMSIKRLASWIVTSVLGFSGPQGWITKHLLKWALTKGYTTVNELLIKWKTHKQAKERLSEYNKVVQNPEATADEINQAGDDFFNR